MFILNNAADNYKIGSKTYLDIRRFRTQFISATLRIFRQCFSESKPYYIKQIDLFIKAYIILLT